MRRDRRCFPSASRTIGWLVLALTLGACSSGGGGSSADGPSDDIDVDEATAEPTPPDDDASSPEAPTQEAGAETIVTVEAGAGGTAQPAEFFIGIGETASIELLADDGYSIGSVRGCRGELRGNSFEIVGTEDDCSVYVRFEPQGQPLLIDVFGEGRILDGDDLVCDAGRSCELRAETRSIVTLSHDAAPGWRFDGWGGCESSPGDTCTLDMSEARAVHPTFVRDADVVLGDDVVVLDAVQLDELLAVDDASLTFSSATPGLDAFVPDVIVVSTRDAGFARRITRVIRLPDTPVLVQTRAVALTDVIEEGTLSFDGASSDSRDVRFEPAPGVEVLEQTTRGVRSTIRFRAPVRDAQGNATPVTISGEIGVSLDPDVRMDFARFRAQGLRFLVAGSVSSALTVSLDGGFDLSLVSVRLGTYTGPPIAAGPVVIVPRYDLFAQLDAKAVVSLSVRTGASAGGTLGARYRRDAEPQWARVASLSADSVPPEASELQSSAEFSLWGGTDVRFLLYGGVGPSLKLGPILGYRQVEPFTGPRAGCIERSGYYGYKGEFGGTVDLLVWRTSTPSLTAQGDLGSWSFGQDAEVRCGEGVYGPPQDLVAAAQADGSVVLSWEPPVGLPLLDYALHRDGTLVSDVFGTTYVDDVADPVAGHCYTVIAFDDRGRTSAPSDRACVAAPELADRTPPTRPAAPRVTDPTTASVVVDWADSTDDSADIAYLVVDRGRVVDRVTSSSATITQLLSGTRYCFSIVAIDPRGNESEPSEEACGRTLAEDAGSWRMRIACEGQTRYALENTVDLEASNAGIINFAGEGNDYSGQALAYIVSGTLDFPTRAFSGRVTYTFSGDDDTRIDVFEVNLSGNDTGDVRMEQIAVTGCTTVVRFDRVDPVMATVQRLKTLEAVSAANAPYPSLGDLL